MRLYRVFLFRNSHSYHSVLVRVTGTTMLAKYQTFFIYALLFGFLFVLHIYFAANNQDFLFQSVAIIITVMSLCCGVICVLLESKDEQYDYVFKIGMIASVPLSIGLGWAYNDMSVGFEMIIFPLISILIHYITTISRIGDTYGLK